MQREGKVNEKLVRGIVAVVMVSGLLLGPLTPILRGGFGAQGNGLSLGHAVAALIRLDGWAGGGSTAYLISPDGWAGGGSTA